MADRDPPKSRGMWIVGLVLLAIVVVIVLYAFTGAGDAP